MDAIAAAKIQCARPDAVARLDEAAFSSFYSRTSRALWSYAYRVTSNAADADDIVQEAFLRLLRAGPEAGEDEWRRYLYRIASNLVVDRWRHRKRQQDDERATAPVAPHSTRRDDEDVARTFAELTARERALLWLAYVEGETHEEMALSLGVGRRSIKVLLFRARRRLRDLLKSRGLAKHS
jgi:RNA polymerase sigma-70 factor, ECF subfamily